MACGELGYTVVYFYSLTERQLVNILKGRQRNNEQLEYQERAEWERQRYLASVIVSVAEGSAEEKKEIIDSFVFPWDKEKQILEKEPKSTEELKSKIGKIEFYKV